MDRIEGFMMYLSFKSNGGSEHPFPATASTIFVLIRFLSLDTQWLGRADTVRVSGQ
jgi:hypothetical protein